MDHPRLDRIFFLTASFIFVSCVSQTAQPVTELQKTFITSKLQPTALLSASQNYLEWQKGYNFKIRDSQRGLAVTDWAFDSPQQRHRITLRTTKDLEGSIISAHTETQIMSNQDWVDIPSNGQRESLLLTELGHYIEDFKTPKPRL